MTRPKLHELPLSEALQPGELTVTLSEGQWDGLLAAFYEGGAVLLELDADERPIRAYRKAAGEA